MRRFVLCSRVALGILLGTRFVSADDIRTVAYGSGPAPGAQSGAIFDYVGDDPVFPETAANRFGRTAFTGSFKSGFGGVTTNDSFAIWSESDGALGLLVRSGNQAPGALAGLDFAAFDRSLRFNNAGQVSIFAYLMEHTSGHSSFLGSRGIWTAAPGQIGLVAKEQDPAPGTSAAIFGPFSLTNIGFALNDAGQTLFNSILTLRVGDTTEDNDTGIWMGAPGAVRLVAREGSAAPGTPAGAVFDKLVDIGLPRLNNSGHVVFRAPLREGSGGVTSANNNGIWLTVSGQLALVARAGSQAPGTPAGAVFGSFDDPTINNSGAIAFRGVLAQDAGGVDIFNNAGLWSTRTGSLELVARRGDPQPGAPSGAVVDWFDSVVMNDAGQIAWTGNLRQGVGGIDHTNYRGVWADRDGTIELIARQGSQAPDLPEGATFLVFNPPTINAAGQIAFLAELNTGAGGVTNENNVGIWAEDRHGHLRLIVRRGDMIQIAPGEYAVVEYLRFTSGSGNADGHYGDFTDDGYVAFGAITTINPQIFVPGIFVSGKVARLAGDFDSNGVVDARDYVVWRKGLGTMYTQSDFTTWRSNFGQTNSASGSGTPAEAVPEPASAEMACVAMLLFAAHRRIQ